LANISCGHYDHFVCMNEWVQILAKCPRCRKDI
jgi:hypothetical protein